jgi:hypothetical protein
MSYCRFSSDNFMCDVYVYEDRYGGFTTHVAGNRYAFPPLPSVPWEWARIFGGTLSPGSRRVTYPSTTKRRAAAVYWWLVTKWEAVRRLTLDRIPRRRIDLPHASKHFNDPTAAECADRLEDLRRLGYVVPQYAIDRLREEPTEPELPHP